MQKCSELSELYTDYIDGALNEKMRAEFDAHLRECPECAKKLESFKSTIHLLNTMQPEALPADFYDRLSVKRRMVKKSRFFLLPAIGAAAAAVVIGVLMVNQTPVNNLPIADYSRKSSIESEKRLGIEKKTETSIAAKAPETDGVVLALPKSNSISEPAKSKNKVNKKAVKRADDKVKIAKLPNSDAFSINRNEAVDVSPEEPDFGTLKNDSLSEKNIPYSLYNSVNDKSDGKSMNKPAAVGEMKSVNSYQSAKSETAGIHTDAKDINANGKSMPAPAIKPDAATEICDSSVNSAGGSGMAVKDKSVNRKGASDEKTSLQPATPRMMMSTAMAMEPQLLLSEVNADAISVKMKGKVITAGINEQNEAVINNVKYTVIKLNSKMSTETGVILQRAAEKEKVSVLINSELIHKKPQNNVNENNGLRAIAASLDAEIYFSGKFVTILTKNLQ